VTRPGKDETRRGEDLALALELADLADSMTLSRFRAEDLQVETKPDLTPVTEADRAVEQAVRERLAGLRPGDAVVGEEFGGEGVRDETKVGDASLAPGSPVRRWIIDPIDGTRGYVRGLPVWATLLALEEDGEVTVGVVSAPALHRRWWAARGEGAFVRDGLQSEERSIRASAVRTLDDAQLSYGSLAEWIKIGRLDALLELAARCWRTRAFGDVWSYMLVAEGAVDVGGVEPNVSLWDLAAPLVIVEEAGGRFTDLHGSRRADGGSGLATNGLLHDATLAIVGL
jgi:histidinol-phosphatase